MLTMTPSALISETKAGGGVLVFLSKPAHRIAGVIEYDSVGNVLELDASDYDLWLGDHYLERLSTGLNPAGHWADRVMVVYSPL